MPEDVKVPQVARVMGIDPSTTNMGVFVVDVCLHEKAPFELVYANTIYGDKVTYDVPVQFDDTSETGVMARGYGLMRSLSLLIEQLKPDSGICEDNYLGASALTYKQLVMFMSQVREAFIANNIHLSFVLPNPAKAIVGANFKGSDKPDVKIGLLKYPHLNANGFILDNCDEHTVDAGAVCLYRAECLAKHYGVFNGD